MEKVIYFIIGGGIITDFGMGIRLFIFPLFLEVIVGNFMFELGWKRGLVIRDTS